MKPKVDMSRFEAGLQDNAAILSRFGWSTSSAYKKCMVAVFIFLIFLFLLRYPIIKWIGELPDPPVIDMGQCEVKGQGKLDIASVHLTPYSNNERVIISFSTNVPTNELIAIQYGTNHKMKYETFAAHSQLVGNTSSHPYFYYASFLINSPGHEYFYRVACSNVHSDTYSFYSWRAGSGWAPTLAIVGGPLTQQTIDTLVHKRHKLSLIAHIDSNESKHANDFLNQIQPLASKVPYLLVPDVTRGPAASQYFHRFPLPGIEWPLHEDTFHTVLGPMVVVGFNSRQLNIDVLRNKLLGLSKLRKTFPWLVVLSEDRSFCLPDKSKTLPTTECQKLFQLFSEFKVDLSISGRSIGYQKTWPIASDGSPLSTYHVSEGFVSVGLGRGKAGTMSLPDLPAQHIMKNLNSVAGTLLYLEFERPDKMCVKVEDSHTQMLIDHACIDKTVAIESLKSSGLLSDAGGTYDLTTWLCLVIILAVIILLSLIFRRILYSKLCKYMESDGGPPIYTGKLLSV